MNTIKETIDDLKQGKIIIVVDDDNRENEGDYVVLGQYATPENINFMAVHGRGLICTPVSAQIANRLLLQSMVEQNTDHHQTAFTVSIDHITVSTGISAFERSTTILSLLDKDTVATDFMRPGHVFPLIAKEGGVLERRGHTEASIDLAKLCDTAEVAVICEIMNDDGTMARLPELELLAQRHSMKIISIEHLVTYLNNNQLKRGIKYGKSI